MYSFFNSRCQSGWIRKFLCCLAAISSGGSLARAAIIPAAGEPVGAAVTTVAYQSAGYGFYTPTGGTVINRLGYWDQGGDGLAISHDVMVVKFNGSNGYNQIAKVTIPAGTAARLEGGYRWVDIPDLVLPNIGQNADFYGIVASQGTDGWTTGLGAGVPLNPMFGTKQNAFLNDNNTPMDAATLRVIGGNAGWGGANFGYEPPSVAPPVTGTRVKIMPLGDSITAGFTDNPTWNTPFEFGYRGPLATMLSNAGYPFRFVGASAEPFSNTSGDPTKGGTVYPVNELRDPGINQGAHRGYGGWTIPQITSNVAGWIATDDPDVILLHIGTNGIGAGSPAQLDTLVSTIFTAKPAVKLVVAQIIPSVSYNADVVTYNNYIRNTLVPAYLTAGRNISTVNQYPNFLTNPADNTSIDTSKFSNAINHPTNAAYQQMASTWLPAVTSVTLGSSTIPVTVVPGAPVTSLSRIGGTAGETFTYTLVAGSGATDNGSFAIVGSGLVAGTHHFELDAPGTTYSIRVQATGSSSGPVVQTLWLTRGAGLPDALPVSIQTFSSSSETAYAADVKTNDLLQGIAGTHLNYNTLAGAPGPQLNNGRHGAAGEFAEVAWATDGNITSSTYELGPGTGSGYDVTGVTTIASWTNAGFMNQKYKVAVRYSGAVEYTNVPDCLVNFQPVTDQNAAGATKVIISRPGGLLFHKIEGIRFTMLDTVSSNNGGVTMREIDVDGTVVPSTTPAPTVFDRVPEASAEGYQVLYDLNIPVDGGFQGATPVPYTVDNSLTALPFDRVAYYMELTNPDGSTRWVYVSMDAFTNIAKQLGLPHNVLNPVLHQRTVTNMNIYSNVSGLTTGTSLDGGCIEMWPSTYLTGRGGLFYAGDGGTYDWDDSGASATTAGYGSFQVHNPLSRQVVFAYNRWSIADGAADDIGIGSQTTGQPDYTLASNAGNYTARHLVILTRPGTHVTFTAVPKNQALYPRDLATNMATVPIAGSETEGGYSNAILRLYRNGVFQTETVQALVYSSGAAPFAFNPQIPAELANYDFEILIEKAGVRRLVKRSTSVVAGDAYLFYGQSNGEAGRVFTANNTTSNGYAGPWVRTFGQNSDSGTATRNNLSWVPANGDGAGSTYTDPGAVGQWAIVIGGKIVADHHVPVALLNGSRQGYAITQLLKDNDQPDNLDDSGNTTRPYNRMRFRAIQGGIAAKARAIFYYQGESDADNAVVHAAGYESLRSSWQTDYPGLQHFYEVQVHVGCVVTQSDVALREAQREFADIYPNTSVMATNGLQPHDGCHYGFIGGYENLGLFHFGEVSRDLYNGPSGPNLDALNPLTVAFTDETRMQIRVTMRDPGATINFPIGALQDFALTGSSAGITGRSVSGNTILLQLDSSAMGSPVLEYRGHSGGGDFVTNGNGIGLLAFSLPVGPQAPAVTITSPAASQESSVGTSFTVTASAAASPNGPAVRMVFLVNGVQQFMTNGSSLNTTWQVPANGAHNLVVKAYDAAGHVGSASVSILAGVPSSPGGVSSGLQVWFKSEAGVTKDASGLVSSWLDQSGNNFNAIQSTAANQPRYVNGAFGIGAGLQFDGNDALTSGAGMPTGSYTKIIRFKVIGTGTSHNLFSSAVGGNASARDHAFFAPNLTPTIYHSGSQVAASQPVDSGAAVIGACTFDAGTNQAKVYVNGVLSGSGTLAGPNTISSFQLGAFANSVYLVGSMGEAIVYNRVLTDAELAAINGYLDDKYRTPFQLWSKGYYGIAGPANADTDGDGLPTLVEYALGLDPTKADNGSPRLPRVTQNGNTIEVSYQRMVGRADVITQLESSPDLTTWTPMAETSVGTTGGVETRHAVMTAMGSSPQLFYRLRVTAP